MGKDVVTVTRLQSDKKSFVQSPLKAFDTESEAPDLTALVTVRGLAFEYYRTSGVGNPPIYDLLCNYQFDISSPQTQWTRLVFSGTLTHEQAHAATYVGVTSGVSFAPALTGALFRGTCRGVFAAFAGPDVYGFLYGSGVENPTSVDTQHIEYFSTSLPPPPNIVYALDYYTPPGEPHASAGLLLNEDVSIFL